MLDSGPNFEHEIMIKQLMELSADTYDSLIYFWSNNSYWNSLNGIQISINLFPFVIIFKPSCQYPILMNLIEVLFNWFPEDLRRLKRELLRRLIHNFQSSEIVSRYASIVRFLSEFTDRGFFQIWEIANRLHDVLLSKPKKCVIAGDFLFWFASRFNELSSSFVRSLERFVEIEEIQRRLPIRYQELWQTMDEKVLNRRRIYSRMQTVEDGMSEALRNDDPKQLMIAIDKNVNLHIASAPFDSD
jgi:hypothetical protein